MSDDPDKPKKKKKPKTKADPAKGGDGSGKPPRKTKVGYGGEGGEFPRFHFGESLTCRVRKKCPGGYEVSLLNSNLFGFLSTELSFEPDDVLICQFAGWDNDRVLLSMYKSNDEWLISFKPGAHESESIARSESKRSKIDLVRLTDYEPRRAYDILMPPLDEDCLKCLKIGDYEPEWLFSDIESGFTSGCLKVDNNDTKSRGAVLLYRGRAVGCMAFSRKNPLTEPTEESLDTVLRLLCEPNSWVSLYDLPESIVLSMAALFLGYPVQRDDEYTSLDYFDYIIDWLRQENGTATIATSLAGGLGMCLAFVNKGAFAGSFIVEYQRFLERECDFRDFLSDHNQNSILGISLLPPAMAADTFRFGFSLSEAFKRIKGEDAS